MFNVSRTVVISLVTVTLAAGPLGCSAPSDASDEAVASGTSDFSDSDIGLLSGQGAHPSPPTDNQIIDQMVATLTKVLALTEKQEKELRGFLQAQAEAYHHAHH
jgi:hypothetical protein